MTTAKQKYVEPTGDDKAGFKNYPRPASAWELFQRSEGVPIFRGIGTSDARELPRSNWDRFGAIGSFIQLLGTNNTTSYFVLEVPARAATKPIKHFWEERYIVLEGRGSTEVYKENSTAKTSFEWQAWSMFAVPLNATFRIVNATSAPAILIGINNAPMAVNMYQSKQILFENPFVPDDRFGGNLEEYWKPGEEFEPHPVQGRAMLSTNLFPDAANCYLPLDNNRGPGYRWVNPNMAGNTVLTGGFIAEYPSGRYSKAHHHGAGAVLICINGKGYSYTWPKDEAGLTPWKDGKADLVKMQEYGPGGMISAAPTGNPRETWFHQHLATSKTPFRVLATWTNLGTGGSEGERVAGVGAELGEGGSSLPYHMEDPHIREYYKEQLKKEGAEFQMPEEAYTEAGANIKIEY